jgi:hypothetical protein
MDLEVLSAKLGITKLELFDILKRLVIDDLNDQLKYYSEKANSSELIGYLNKAFSEEDFFDKLSEELERL